MQSKFLTNTFQQISNETIPAARNPYSTIEKPNNPSRPRLMCILAHPDDESLCLGGTLAKYAAKGVEISLVVATRGERGWRGSAQDNPGLQRMGEIREAELRIAARVLGVREVNFLDYTDGDVSAVPVDELVAKIAFAVRRFRPDVVITFDPHGMYGHPDHIAISQATTNAVWDAADPAYATANSLGAHRVSKLYYRVFTENALACYQEIFGELKMQIASQARVATAWRDWAMTTKIQVRRHSSQVWDAISCHRSQLPMMDEQRERFLAYYASALGVETYFRVFGCGANAPASETDLFEGVRVNSNAGATFYSQSASPR